MTEFLSPEWITLAATSMSVANVSLYIFMTAYFDWVSKHYIYICFVSLLFTILSLVLIKCMPESPLFLLKSGQIEKAKIAIKRIMHINKVPSDEAIDMIASKRHDVILINSSLNLYETNDKT